MSRCAVRGRIARFSRRSGARYDEGAFHEIETKYIFGFAEGSGIGLEGEWEFSPETFAGFGKRQGRYAVTETKLEVEHTPSQYVQIEFGPVLSSYNIRNVPDLDDRHDVALSGFFGELRYLVVERGPSSPLAVTLSLEPEWHARDETGGARVINYALEAKINADLELIRNRLFAGFNLLYEPETTKSGQVWEKEATLGVSAALAYRIVPSVLIGAEVWYLRHYDGIGFDAFTGDAVFVGPVIYLQLSRKVFMTAAWNTQIAGREISDKGTLPLDLADFSRHRVKLKLAVEF
jgi:hypothetical protein